MKIGILTHYNVYNQGAQLQLAAMAHWLEDHGHTPIVLTYEKNFDFWQDEREKNSGSIRALPYYLQHYLLEKGPGLTLFNVRKVLAHRRSWKAYTFAPYNDSGCDAVIIGSDEVFSIDVGCNRMMYGHDLGGVPAVAYAPSFGRTTMDTLEEYACTEIVASGLKTLKSLSARDAHTQAMLRELTGKEVPLVCDPVLLYQGDALGKQVATEKRPYLLVYGYDRNFTDSGEIAAIRGYAKRHGLKTVSVGTYHGWCDRNVPCDAGQWYRWFRDAVCVVTDTFHGSVVAMKNHCNTAIFIRESINTFKLRSLLDETGMESRELAAVTEDELERVLSCPVDYPAVDARIRELAEKSEAYLCTALEELHGEHQSAK